LAAPRIIAGKAKGMRLQDVPGDNTRPITDRVKESLFNIIGKDIEDSSIFDLFGGTGSVGIEALSRGAKFARFIDNHHFAVATIKRNLDFTLLKNHAEVFHGDALSHLRQTPDRQFEYIYIAPPQYKRIWQKAIKVLNDNPGWMCEDCWVVVQIHPIEYEKLELRHLNEFEQRRYGSTLLVFYENQALPQSGN
jgi:16S rRNA (guanine966-N2)-methyltransferase